MYRAAYACHLDHEADIGMSRLGRFPRTEVVPNFDIPTYSVLFLVRCWRACCNAFAEHSGRGQRSRCGFACRVDNATEPRGERREAFSYASVTSPLN